MGTRMSFTALNVGLAMALLASMPVAAGCSRKRTSKPRSGYQAAQPGQFPGKQVQKVKDLMDSGMVLFRQALDASTQDEKNSLARRALDSYYHPAQEILEKVREQYPEYVHDIDGLYQELNRRILDATRMIGTGD